MAMLLNEESEVIKGRLDTLENPDYCDVKIVASDGELSASKQTKKYWDREKGARRLLPEQERFLDTKRLNNVKAKFNAKNYDNGQYRFNEKELYCEPCDVQVRSRDQMQVQKDGVKHKKRSAKVAVFECKLCWIKVPCQDTLNNHMRGTNHLKRVMCALQCSR